MDPSNPHKLKAILMGGTSHPSLFELIEKKQDYFSKVIRLIKDKHSLLNCELTETRGKSVYILESGTRSPDDVVMELLALGYNCKIHGALRIVGIIPYLPYGRQCVKTRRNGVVGALMAKMMKSSGYSHLITVDLSHSAAPGFFDFPVQNISPLELITKYIVHNISDYKNAVVIASRVDMTEKAHALSKSAQLGFGLIYDESDGSDHLDGNQENEDKGHALVGCVKNKIAILIDDVIDDILVYEKSIAFLRRSGARKIYIVATHAYLSEAIFEQLNAVCIEQLITTNTIRNDEFVVYSPKVKILDISELVIDAIYKAAKEDRKDFVVNRNVQKDNCE
ncbi:hypothetical protein ACOME3_005617 [Neoechinorhynchus agilis]